jgi:hypothetical protein
MPINSLTNIPQVVTSRAITHNFSQEEQDRRDKARLNKEFYYSKQDQQIVLVNEDMEPVYLNFTYPIVRKRATMLYSQPNVREFVGSSQSIKFLEQVYKDNIIDELLLQVDLNAELTGSVIVTPVIDESKISGVRLRMYDASNISPLSEEDDPSVLEALSIVRIVDRIPNENINKITSKNAEVKRVLKQQIWTKTDILTYEGEVLVSSESNELDFLPFVNFKGEEVYDQYIGYAPARPIRELNETLNRILTDLGMTVKFQAFTPIAVSGFSGDSIISLHPGRALNLPAGAGADVLATSPKIKETMEFIAWLEDKAYETNQTPKISVVGGGEARSGRELVIRWFPLLQVFEEKSQRYKRYELELANLILRWAGMPFIEEVNVKFNRESVLPLQEEEDTLELDISLNIKTAVDEVMRRNPALTEAEAEAIVLSNRDFNQSLIKEKDKEENESFFEEKNKDEDKDDNEDKDNDKGNEKNEKDNEDKDEETKRKK